MIYWISDFYFFVVSHYRLGFVTYNRLLHFNIHNCIVDNFLDFTIVLQREYRTSDRTSVLVYIEGHWCTMRMKAWKKCNLIITSSKKEIYEFFPCLQVF